MMSQMNQVQNAARMAMDHRAASPLRRRQVRDRGRMPWGIAAIGALALLALAVLLA